MRRICKGNDSARFSPRDKADELLQRISLESDCARMEALSASRGVTAGEYPLMVDHYPPH